MKTITKSLVFAAFLTLAWGCSSSDGDEDTKPTPALFTAPFSATPSAPDWHIDWSWHDNAPSWQVQKGDYYYSSGWQVDNNETPNFFTLTNGDITLSTDYQQLPCKYLFVIPQSKQGMELVLTYTVGTTQKTRKLDLDGEWDAGIEYTINIRVGSSFIEQ